MTEPPLPPPPPPAHRQPPPPAVGSAPLQPYSDPAAWGAAVAPVPLERTAGLERAARGLVAAAGVFAVITPITRLRARDEARDLLAGELTDDEFIAEIAPSLFVPAVLSLITIVTAVVVIVWMYRVASNHQRLQRQIRWSPGWAIGGWLLPPSLCVIPYLMLCEMWKAADPDVAPGSDEWRSNRVSPAVHAWFILYGVIGTAVLIVAADATFFSFAATEDELAKNIIDGQSYAIISAITTAASAIAFGETARRLGSRHRRLTGEDRA